jgi:multidrug efflux pump subunit AcrB
MIRIAIVLSMLVAGLLTPVLSQASDATLETSHLIVSDTTGNLSTLNPFDVY